VWSRPGRRFHDGPYDGGGEDLGVHEVLRILPGAAAEIGVDDRKCGKVPRSGVGEKLPDPDDARMALDRLTGEHVAGGRKARVVVPPGDLVGVQAVEDCPLGSGDGVLRKDVVDHPDRSSSQKVAAVGLRLAQHRGKPAVCHREHSGQRVCPRQILAGPVAHGDRAAVRGDEPIVPAAVELVVGSPPWAGQERDAHPCAGPYQHPLAQPILPTPRSAVPPAVAVPALGNAVEPRCPGASGGRRYKRADPRCRSVQH